MRGFEYEASRGSFRGWLKTVTTNAVRDLGRQWQTRNIRPAGDTAGHDQLLSISDERALNELTQRIESHYREELLREARGVVEQRVQPATWRAWQGTAVEDRAVSDVAAEVGMSVSEVYVAKSRVNKMMREIVQRMESAESL